MDFVKRRLMESLIPKDDFSTLKENMNYSQQLTKTGSWTYNVNTKEAFWSDEIYNILDCGPETLSEKLENFDNYIHADDVDEVSEKLQYILEGKDYDIEYRIITSKDEKKYINEKVKAIYDEDNNLIKVVGIIQDITNRKRIENSLKEFGKSLNRSQKVAGIGSWEFDVTKNKMYWSDQGYRIFGIEPEGYDGRYGQLLEFVHPEDVKMIINIIENPSKKIIDLEFRITRLDGSLRDIYKKIEFIFDNDEKPIYAHGIIQDITEKKELNRQIERKQKEIISMEKKFKVLIQESNDGFGIIESDGIIRYMSESVVKITGFKVEELVGRNVYNFYEGEELEKLINKMKLVLSDANKKVKMDIAFKTKLNKTIYLETYMQNLLEESVINGIAINFRDITRRIEMEKRSNYIANHDQLTNLPNDVYFIKELRLQWKCMEETNTRFGLMMLDLTGLKYVNYSLGYNIGDELIISIVKRLTDYLGKNKILYRYSGDQFSVIIQEDKTYEEYEYIAIDIIDLFSYPFKIRSYELNIGVNIGICICPDDTKDINLVSKQPKIALLRSKKEGKNTYKFYSPELDVQNYKESVLRSDLHSAIDNEQLMVYYQPIIDLKTNKILGAEALIRWEHPEWGIVLAEEFISLAEESGLISSIGKWILREVCVNYSKWINDGLPSIKVSVNISGIQFLESDFVNTIKNIIDEYSLDPSFLIIEITENVLIKNIDKVNLDIKKLQTMGIQIALDDFGTGFSSLIYLSKFNIDILKLDKSFVKNIPLDETSTAITKLVINLAKDLKIKMIAEGIENHDQLSYLKNLNCHAGQGYIYSKPAPLEEFEKILAKGKCKPLLFNNMPTKPQVERRNFFRIKFMQLLESDMTILEIRGKKIDIGNTKVLVKNIGPGGLNFISNIKFPVEKDIILQFTMKLMGKDIKVYGYLVRIEEIDDQRYRYGVEFSIDENERGDLIGDLNTIQIKLRKNISFSEGNFISGSYNQYFK